MKLPARLASLSLALAILLVSALPAAAQDTTVAGAQTSQATSQATSQVATAWFDLVLELIRETPGFTPPVASRALGYAGVTLYEAVAPGIPGAQSLAGQINELPALPQPEPGAVYDWPMVANSAMAGITRRLFAGGGEPQRAAIDGLETSLRKQLAPALPKDVTRRSIQYGRLVSAAIFAWSRTDGGHEAYMFNFPKEFVPATGEGLWERTGPAYQRPMQPYWGDNRTFALVTGDECAPPPPPPYSTDPASAMYQEAKEVYDTVRALTPEQREIALYWSDDPMLTATPPGHWFAIATQLIRDENVALGDAAELYARLGIAVADSFIGCWKAKYVYNRVRPITYIQQIIDPSWNASAPTDPVLTPPFPEYTSGHSTESGAAAVILSYYFGAAYPFVDRSQMRLGFAPRSFSSFAAAADEAAISRLYGGIHYRSANENGLAQGRCIGDRVLQLRMGQDN